MMTMKDPIIMLHEKEDLFLQFLHSFLTFLIYIYTCSTDNGEEHYIEHQNIEMSLTDSLTLIWQMHVSIFTLKNYYRKANYLVDTELTFNQKQSELIIPQLEKMKLIIDSYPFIEKTDTLHYLSLLEQIKSYYKQCELTIVRADLHADPWLAYPLEPQRQMLGRCNAKDD